MTGKKLIAVVLLAFVAASVGYALVRELGGGPQAPRPGQDGGTVTRAGEGGAVAPTQASGRGQGAAAVAPGQEAGGAPPGREASAFAPGLPAGAPVGKDSVPSSRKVLVYYFHGTKRCPTCRAIETYSQRAVESDLAQAVADGRLEDPSVNVDDPENEHFVQDYQMISQTLIVMETKDGKAARWKKLDKIWDLAGDEPAFLTYVDDEVRAYLEGER